ncbi:MAG: hypothetical protein CO118_05760 [Flavobacteriales bacterium CG_4_9_14_3_um_filter_32_8]|nr:MAG: hypothetical protein CO118_05760 [Flavobacteriales bacterium CG_4_9_14_3_um_filter_32_8]
MINTETNNNMTIVCNLNYLSGLMGGKEHLIKKIMDTFLIQVKEELDSINDAILKKDYITIKNLAHTMKSSVSIMGISALIPILQEMEDLGKNTTALERIIALNKQLNLICKQAFKEIKNYSFS